MRTKNILAKKPLQHNGFRENDKVKFRAKAARFVCSAVEGPQEGDVFVHIKFN